jgi:hypothetical protein
MPHNFFSPIIFWTNSFPSYTTTVTDIIIASTLLDQFRHRFPYKEIMSIMFLLPSLKSACGRTKRNGSSEKSTLKALSYSDYRQYISGLNTRSKGPS